MSPFSFEIEASLKALFASCQHHYFYGGEQNIVILAVLLLLSIAQNHAFAQGNKRAAFLAALMFIETNGYVFDVEGSTELADLIVDVIERKVDKDALVAEFSRITRRSVSKSSVNSLRPES